MKWEPFRGCSISFHCQLHPPISLLGWMAPPDNEIVMKYIGKQYNHIDRNHIDEIANYIDEIDFAPSQEWNCGRHRSVHFIENPQENNEMVNTQFQWKALVRQWNGRLDYPHFIHRNSITSMKITSMEFHRWNGWCDPWMKLHRKPLVKRWNGRCSISLKPLRKTMKWADCWWSGHAHFIHPGYNYIDEITSMQLHRCNE